jgi:hypothetical protein
MKKGNSTSIRATLKNIADNENLDFKTVVKYITARLQPIYEQLLI